MKTKQVLEVGKFYIDTFNDNFIDPKIATLLKFVKYENNTNWFEYVAGFDMYEYQYDLIGFEDVELNSDFELYNGTIEDFKAGKVMK